MCLDEPEQIYQLVSESFSDLSGEVSFHYYRKEFDDWVDLVEVNEIQLIRIVTRGIIDGECIDSKQNDNIGADTW